jgi:hypothetical protein
MINADRVRALTERIAKLSELLKAKDAFGHGSDPRGGSVNPDIARDAELAAAIRRLASTQAAHANARASQSGWSDADIRGMKYGRRLVKRTK